MNACPGDAPNIGILMLDDAGPALPATYGGSIQTPTMTRVAQSGITYNRFSQCGAVLAERGPRC